MDRRRHLLRVRVDDVDAEKLFGNSVKERDAADQKLREEERKKERNNRAVGAVEDLTGDELSTRMGEGFLS